MLWKGFSGPSGWSSSARRSPTGSDGSTRSPSSAASARRSATLRRVLLSSIDGAAVTAVKIDGVLHEFSPIPGVVEDATDIILNLKQIPLKMHVDTTKTLYLRVDKAGECQGARHRDRRRRRNPRAGCPHRHRRRGRQAPHGDARQARPRLRRGRQELRRGSRHRLDPDRLRPLADQEGELPGRGGAYRSGHRLRQADRRRVDQRLGDAARRGVAVGQADSRSPEHLHQPRGCRRSAAGRAPTSAARPLNENLDKSVEELELSVVPGTA